MQYFNYEDLAREAAIDPTRLERIRIFCHKEFPNDEMLAELHVLRICKVIKAGKGAIDEMQGETPTPTTAASQK